MARKRKPKQKAKPCDCGCKDEPKREKCVIERPKRKPNNQPKDQVFTDLEVLYLKGRDNAITFRSQLPKR